MVLYFMLEDLDAFKIKHWVLMAKVHKKWTIQSETDKN